jgi:hypothetical protein
MAAAAVSEGLSLGHVRLAPAPLVEPFVCQRALTGTVPVSLR